MNRSTSRLPLILLLAPLLFPALATAQAPARPKAPSPAAAATTGDPAARVTEIDFLMGDEVEGTREAPAGVYTEGETTRARPSLVRVRDSFRAALLDSAESM